MATHLTVKKVGKDKVTVSYRSDHPKAEDIEKWLSYLSAGYTEYLLQFGTDPHCSACRDVGCENVGNGDDACRAFMFGMEW